MCARLILIATVLSVLSLSAAWADDDSDEPVASGMVDVKFADGSSIKLALRHETYNLQTPYGKLAIPAKDIRLIELAPRVADDVAKQIEEAVANLGSPQFEIREKAAADLIRLGPQGYPVLLRLSKAKRTDLEITARLDDVLDKVRGNLP